MSDEALTDDERELLRLAGELAKAWESHGDGAGAESAILAHYRKAKAGGFEPRPTVPVYTADDGTLWVEAPNGAHGWWSTHAGGADGAGSSFDPWERQEHDPPHGSEQNGGYTLRYYRRVEKR